MTQQPEAISASEFVKHLEHAAAIVKTWPEWKQSLLGSPPEPKSQTPDWRKRCRTGRFSDGMGYEILSPSGRFYLRRVGDTEAPPVWDTQNLGFAWWDDPLDITGDSALALASAPEPPDLNEPKSETCACGHKMIDHAHAGYCKVAGCGCEHAADASQVIHVLRHDPEKGAIDAMLNRPDAKPTTDDNLPTRLRYQNHSLMNEAADTIESLRRERDDAQDKSALLARQLDDANRKLVGLDEPALKPASGGEKVDSGVALIATERERQVSKEGWTPEHDDEHRNGELADAAASYALTPHARRYVAGQQEPDTWPWDHDWWKPTPKDRIRELTKAGALIAAEIDRLLRLIRSTKPRPSPSSPPTPEKPTA